MSAAGDDEPAPRRGVVPPPPDGSPDSVRLPRMEPPPPSLEAMVQSRAGAGDSRSSWSWLLWVALLLAAVLVTGYVVR